MASKRNKRSEDDVFDPVDFFQNTNKKFTITGLLDLLKEDPTALQKKEKSTRPNLGTTYNVAPTAGTKPASVGRRIVSTNDSVRTASKLLGGSNNSGLGGMGGNGGSGGNSSSGVGAGGRPEVPTSIGSKYDIDKAFELKMKIAKSQCTDGATIGVPSKNTGFDGTGFEKQKKSDLSTPTAADILSSRPENKLSTDPEKMVERTDASIESHAKTLGKKQNLSNNLDQSLQLTTQILAQNSVNFTDRLAVLKQQRFDADQDMKKMFVESDKNTVDATVNDGETTARSGQKANDSGDGIFKRSSILSPSRGLNDTREKLNDLGGIMKLNKTSTSKESTVDDSDSSWSKTSVEQKERIEKQSADGNTQTIPGSTTGAPHGKPPKPIWPTRSTEEAATKKVNRLPLASPTSVSPKPNRRGVGSPNPRGENTKKAPTNLLKLRFASAESEQRMEELVLLNQVNEHLIERLALQNSWLKEMLAKSASLKSEGMNSSGQNGVNNSSKAVENSFLDIVSRIKLSINDMDTAIQTRKMESVRLNMLRENDVTMKREEPDLVNAAENSTSFLDRMRVIESALKVMKEHGNEDRFEETFRLVQREILEAKADFYRKEEQNYTSQSQSAYRNIKLGGQNPVKNMQQNQAGAEKSLRSEIDSTLRKRLRWWEERSFELALKLDALTREKDQIATDLEERTQIDKTVTKTLEAMNFWTGSVCPAPSMPS